MVVNGERNLFKMDNQKEIYEAWVDEVLGLNELSTKKKTLRNKIGLPIGAGIFLNSEPVTTVDSGVGEMLNFAKKVQEIIRRRGDQDEVYDIEEDIDGYRTYIKDSTGIIKPVNFGYIEGHTPKKKEPVAKSTLKKDTKYWAAPFWDQASVHDMIAEIVNPKQVDISNIQQHQELNPKFWAGDKIKPEVRKALLKNALGFLKNLSIPDIKIDDIVITGSLANFNYTDESDLDVHIMIDFSQIDGDENLVKEFFLAKRADWNESKEIYVYDHEVEVVVEDTNENNTWSSAYSLMKDEWVQKPIKNLIELNKNAIQLKASAMMNTIDRLEREENSENGIHQADRIKKKLRKMRSSGLRKEGEYSVENLTYKVLRYSGYIDKLKQLKNKFTVDDLSL
jgi:predicted nucleotidyltransferase